MGTVIYSEHASAERVKLLKGISLAIRELASKTSSDHESLDIAAFIAMSLAIFDRSVEQSITAWEKRGYWIKADRYRLEWTWAGILGEKMANAVLNNDWESISGIAIQIAQKCQGVKISSRYNIGKPWIGAYEKFLHLRA